MRLIVKEKYKQLHLSPQYGGISVLHISVRIGRIRTITIHGRCMQGEQKQ